MIIKVSELLLDKKLSKSHHKIPPKVKQLLVLARNSISSITTATSSYLCRKGHHNSQLKRWNDKLSKLTVQCEFTATTELESQNYPCTCASTFSSTYPIKSVVMSSYFAISFLICERLYTTGTGEKHVYAAFLRSDLALNQTELSNSSRVNCFPAYYFMYFVFHFLLSFFFLIFLFY